MATLKQLKSVFSFVTKTTRPLLTRAVVGMNNLMLTDLDTIIEFNDNFGLEKGFYDIKTIGLTNPVDEDIDEYPHGLFNFDINEIFSFSWSQKGIESFLPFCSKDETRRNLNGVAINLNHLVATDGHVLKCESLGENKTDESFIMPLESLQILNKLLKKYKTKDRFMFYLNEEYFVVKNDNFNFKGRLIKREYPKWQAVIPNKYQHEFTINNWLDYKELKPLFNRNNAIKIELNEGAVVVTIHGHDKTYIIGQCPHALSLKFGFNAKLFDTCVENNKEEIKVKFNNELAPMLINDNIGMPLKIEKDK